MSREIPGDIEYNENVSPKDKVSFIRKNLPELPGCYLFKDKNNTVIYVGKAKSLRKRVNSYWNFKKNTDPLYIEKIHRLVEEIRDIDYFVVENESEALLLENELIKKHQPRYNILLKDDKSFPWIQITDEDFPRISVIRKPEDHGINHEYLGPFVNASYLRKMLQFIRKIFPYRTCSKSRFELCKKRPCIYFQIKLCPAPPYTGMDKKEYHENLNKVKDLILGNVDTIEEYIKKKMEDASRKLLFEEAIIWRDRLEALKMFTIHQSVLIFNKNLLRENEDKAVSIFMQNLDAVTGLSSKRYFALLVLQVRNGRLLGKVPYIVNFYDKIIDPDNFFEELFKLHYLRSDIGIPDKIITKFRVSGEVEEVVSNHLSNLAGKRVSIVPISDINALEGLMRIADKNIILMLKQKEEFSKFIQKSGKDIAKTNLILEDLARILNLDSVPLIIEAFDMSHISGSDYVGSKVSFLEGMPNKSEYRRYRVNLPKEKPNDVLAMKKVVERRFRRLVREGEVEPDLILIDGGLPQLNVVDSVLKALNLSHIPHVGIAKPEGRSEIMKPPTLLWYEDGALKKLKIDLTSPSLHLIQHIRNEAHRFAIKYHKVLRLKRNLSSELDSIPGIGPARKEKLLKYFGSVENIRNASEDELEEIIGKKLAIKIKEYLENSKKG